MLSITSIKQAKSCLFQKYLKTKNFGTGEICNLLNIATVEVRDLKSNNLAELHLTITRKYLIKFIPCGGDWRVFLIQHELAHYYLIKSDIPSPTSDNERSMVERWCDNFATAYIISRFYRNVILNQGNFMSFFDADLKSTPGRLRLYPRYSSFFGLPPSSYWLGNLIVNILEEERIKNTDL